MDNTALGTLISAKEADPMFEDIDRFNIMCRIEMAKHWEYNLGELSSTPVFAVLHIDGRTRTARHRAIYAVHPRAGTQL